MPASPASDPGMGLLRLTTCGSVDDGKSTLLGRLLYESAQILDDQLHQLARDSRRHGTAGEELDYALLLDGLEAEREQGITIDVAYRFAATPRRRLIIADAPGHAQYTRNMATAASVSDLAIVLVDARRGLLTQTRRHTAIAALMGVRHVVLAVNKMDLVGYDRTRFEAIARDYAALAGGEFRSIVPIPLSARHGDNVTAPSPATPWYEGPSLLAHLDRVEVDDERLAGAFRLPVQWVNRPDEGFRGYAGTVVSGRVRAGDRVAVSGSGAATTVRRICTFDGDPEEAAAGDAVTLVLADELDVSRGDVLSAAAQPVSLAEGFAAQVIWLADEPLRPGRELLLKLGARTAAATLARIEHRIDMDSGERGPADALALNDVARVELLLGQPVAYAPYRESRTLGGFILIDRESFATAGVGVIEHALPRAANLTWQALDISRDRRAAMKGQRPAVLWFTGLSGAGKSTIANLVERRLHAMGRHTYVLDGDNVRQGLNRDLGFSEADRVENIRRVGEVAALFADAGLIALVSFISPYRAERDRARATLPAGEFLEVFVDTPIEECRRRDPKGLYVRADAGQIPDFTGVSAPYEPPTAPEIHLRTLDATPEAMAEQVVAALRARGVLG